MKDEFLKQRYDFELDRKDKLTAALALPVGVLGVLGSAGIAMIRTFTYRDPTLKLMFVVVAAAGIVAFTVCLFLLARAYLAQTYVYLPLLQEMLHFEQEMIGLVGVMAGGEAEVREDFERELRRRIIAAADANTASNDRRSKWLHWSRIALFVTVGFVYIAGFVYVADQLRFAMPTQEAPKPVPATTTPQASVPERPTFPPNRVIKEGREPGTIEKK